MLYIVGYTRGQGSSLSPRGYGSNGSTPHSNGSGYSSAAMNGYHAPTGGLGNMGKSILYLSQNIIYKSFPPLKIFTISKDQR